MRSKTSMQESETLSRRDCLTSVAAAALGYTLAAGPVRAAAGDPRRGPQLADNWRNVLFLSGRLK